MQTTSNIKYSQDRYISNGNRYMWMKPDSRHFKYIAAGGIHIFRERILQSFQYVPQFAYYEKTTETKEGRIINIFEVIDIMRSDALKAKAKEIMAAQELGDMPLKSKLKKALPYITHAGVFIPRCNSGLTLPGFTYQLDIDNIPDAKQVLGKLIKDPELNVLIASKSVSGNGVKAILFLKELIFLRDEWTHEQYRTAYHAATDILQNYFKQKYGVSIDTQMKAISQPFYLFYAPDLFINKKLF